MSRLLSVTYEDIPLTGNHTVFVKAGFLNDFLFHLLPRLKVQNKPWVIAFEEIKALTEFLEFLPEPLSKEIESMTNEIEVFPPLDILPFEQVKASVSTVRSRVKTLCKIAQSPTQFGILTTIPMLFYKTVKPDTLYSSSLSIRKGQIISSEELVRFLTQSGFQRVFSVETPGEFSVRGFIIDFFGLFNTCPVRIELFGDEINDIRLFDPQSQVSTSKLEETHITAFQEGLFKEQNLALFDARVEELMNKYPYSLFLEKLRSKPQDFSCLSGILFPDYPALIHSLPKDTLFFFLNFENSIEKYRNYEKELFELYPQPELKELFFRYIRVSETALQTVNHCLSVYTGALPAVSADDTLATSTIKTSKGAVFSILPTGLTLTKKKAASSAFLDYPNQVIPSFEELEKNDFVVHEDFGIARYLGNEVIKNYAGVREYMKLEYEDQVRIFVPVENLDRIHRYIGDESLVKLTRLKSNSWGKTKTKVKEDIEEKVDELIQLYAIRKTVTKEPVYGDSELETRFSSSFPYLETNPQTRSISEVFRDLEKEYPMDRLVFGDAGSGKTEIAMRAAFRMALNGKQTALLVPTTILSKQHYESFAQRFEPFGVRVAVLNRFVTDSDKKKALKSVAEGSTDIVIGTHSLLSNRIQFKKLGLLIVDEEQKFGVSQKEKLKKLKTQIDVLTLSATPIPRTLYMGFSGIKEMSLVDVLPPGRIPVESIVTTWDDRIVKTGMLRELSRGGQVIFVHNRVEDIADSFEQLHKLVPEAKIGLAHGQMKKSLFEKTIQSFYDGEIDALVCTTIIESGVDIPNANTLIINDAQRYGLSQLYQLRGRVGRSDRRAYAYFLYPKNARLSAESRARLEAIQTFKGAGSGMQLALKDMEIRGIGNLLGFEQHGSINTIGLHLYQQLLDDILIRHGLKESAHPVAKGAEESAETIQVEFKGFELNCVITEYYISNQIERMKIYRKIAISRTITEIDDIQRELEDRFGVLEDTTAELLLYSRIRVLAFLLGISKIERFSQSKDIKIVFSDLRKIDQFQWMELRGFSNLQTLEVVLFEQRIQPTPSASLRPASMPSLQQLYDLFYKNYTLQKQKRKNT